MVAIMITRLFNPLGGTHYSGYYVGFEYDASFFGNETLPLLCDVEV